MSERRGAGAPVRSAADWPRGSAPPSASAGACPCCGGPRLRRLLETSAPIHTSKLVASREEALAYPRGVIRLEICESCGFLTNTAFDSEGHDYSASYEETQAFSPRFQEYAAGLADLLVRRHGISADDQVLEIGCGRGEFLVTLCERAGCRGVGVDPSYREGDIPATAASRVEVRRAFFDARHVDRRFAVVVCRHTLEHVHDVAGFLRAVREGLERSPDATLVVEIPDSLRILRETAFWDVFYEHCSYFTPGSVARALRSSGLEPTSLELTYDDQYILVSARRAAAATRPPFDLEEPVEEVTELADRFVAELEAMRRHWSTTLRATSAQGRSSVIWGAGSKGVAFLATLGITDEISCVVDVNPAKHGAFMLGSGHEIVAPEHLRAVRPDQVIVMNPIYVGEIGGMLRDLGVSATVVAV